MHTTHAPNPELNCQRQHLEALVKTPPRDRWGLVKTLKHSGQNAIRFLAGQTEPHIRQRIRHGQEVWVAHDPVTNRTGQFATEQDLLRWLENRYYQ